MNKTELASQLAESLKVSKADGLLLVEAVFALIIRDIARGASIELRNIGTFYSEKRGARVGRNPRTGSTMEIPASNRVRFKPYSEWLDSVN